MATIKAIEGRSIHQIQSGQVIVDLCSVVKELVENSLDAGATSIDVRFKNNGLESVEVQDNGGGIPPDDYETIALKHYTSKLLNYNDLDSLTTFGFRGEALSSLCALSKFHITTARDGEAPKGTRLEFEVSGKLKGTSVAACPKGTVVCAEDLFYNLPVRRRELEKNIKREYGKVLSILHAYACISKGVRFSVSNQPAKGKKAIVFSTKSNRTTRENIANIYGAKTLSALVPLDLKLLLQPTGGQTLKETQSRSGESRQVEVAGHISRPVFGEGRQTPDRQMFFVNSRPCGLPQIAKVFNEVYKSYNLSQSPFIFANLIMDTNAYDVNVSPDKRIIMLHDQNALLESLKESLVSLFESQDQTIPQSQLASDKSAPSRPLKMKTQGFLSSTVQQDQQDAEVASSSGQVTDPPSPPDSSRNGSGPATEHPEDEAHGPKNLAHDFQSAPGNDMVVQGEESASSGLGRKVVVQSFLAGNDWKSSGELEKVTSDSTAEPLQFNQLTDQSLKGGQDSDYPSVDTLEHDAEKVGTSKSQSRSLSPAHGSLKQDWIRSNLFAPSSTQNLSKAKNKAARSFAQPSDGSHGANKRRRIHVVKDPTQSPGLASFVGNIRNFAAPGTPLDASGSDRDAESEGETKMVRDGDMDINRPVPAIYDEGEEQGSEVGSGDDVSGSEVDSGDEFVDETEKKQREEARVAEMLRQAEAAAALPSPDHKKRAAGLLKSRNETECTVSLVKPFKISIEDIENTLTELRQVVSSLKSDDQPGEDEDFGGLSPQTSPEERLSLTVTKADFAKMNVVGQFNLGFILATRTHGPVESALTTSQSSKEDLFIIDQHASDEIYNFSRLSQTTTLTPQPLVHPHVLDLTAVEEEIILSHTETLAKNGFKIVVDMSGDAAVGQRCKLLTLPTSKETVFDTRDLEELIALLGEASLSATSERETVRPSKVRRMLAMRACRSSIMVGRTLTQKGMETVVRHMGEIDRPWNCPHGRPTMRHLANLSDWSGWSEGSGLVDDDEESGSTDWAAYLQNAHADASTQETNTDDFGKDGDVEMDGDSSESDSSSADESSDSSEVES